jgi:hypothetical protein
MSSRATVPPASTSMVVILTGFDTSSPVGVKVSWYLLLVNPTLARRMSERHTELTPVRWPTEGMIKAFAGGAVLVVELTGVTRLTDTGALTVVLSRVLTWPTALAPVCSATRMVPLNVPLTSGSSAGLKVTVKSKPDGGMTPVIGATVNHG